MTPRFGGYEQASLAKALGRHRVLWSTGEVEYPRFPKAVSTEDTPERCLAGGEIKEKPRPVSYTDLPRVFEEVRDGKYLHHIAVRWDRPVVFTDGKTRKTVWFNISAIGPVEAKERAWSYFEELFDRGCPETRPKGLLRNKTKRENVKDRDIMMPTMLGIGMVARVMNTSLFAGLDKRK